MKAKVFKYKFDGNTVVAPYMELEPYAENVYLSLSTKNEYGNESEDIFHVVCKIENVFFSCGQHSRRFLDKEERKETTAAYCKNWITPFSLFIWLGRVRRIFIFRKPFYRKTKYPGC